MPKEDKSKSNLPAGFRAKAGGVSGDGFVEVEEDEPEVANSEPAADSAPVVLREDDVEVKEKPKAEAKVEEVKESMSSKPSEFKQVQLNMQADSDDDDDEDGVGEEAKEEAESEEAKEEEKTVATILDVDMDEGLTSMIPPKFAEALTLYHDPARLLLSGVDPAAAAALEIDIHDTAVRFLMEAESDGKRYDVPLEQPVDPAGCKAKWRKKKTQLEIALAVRDMGLN